MKKIILIIFFLVFLAYVLFSQTRPTNDYKIVFKVNAEGDKKSEVVNSETGLDMAVKTWREKHIKDGYLIVAVCQISYAECQ